MKPFLAAAVAVIALSGCANNLTQDHKGIPLSIAQEFLGLPLPLHQQKFVEQRRQERIEKEIRESDPVYQLRTAKFNCRYEDPSNRSPFCKEYLDSVGAEYVKHHAQHMANRPTSAPLPLTSESNLLRQLNTGPNGAPRQPTEKEVLTNMQQLQYHNAVRDYQTYKPNHPDSLSYRDTCRSFYAGCYR